VADDAAMTAPVYVPGTVAMAGDRPVATFELEGLAPGRQHHYAVEVAGRLDAARRGRFRTFPEGAASFRVAVGGCARVGSNGRVFDAIRAQDPDLVLLLGDLYYGNVGVPEVSRFRRHLERVLTRPAQSTLYRSAPVAYVWDDHDYGPDGADGSSPTRGPVRQAYGEYVPHYDLPAGDGGPIYQAFTIGRVRFVVTDLRSARDPASEPDGPAKTMLGTAQRAWLEQELADAADRYALVVLVSSVPWIGDPRAGADGWMGYASEREQLARSMAAHGVRNLLMLGGDAHMVAIDDGSHTAYGGGPSFPLMHAAALDQLGSTKGGPYSEGAYPGSGQFGTLDVQDDGRRLVVTLTGRRWNGDVIASYRYELDG
jgi:phosphodiesterase/alkaline phosphatase D-like protein